MLKIFIVYLAYFVKDATMKQSCEAENQYRWSYHGPDNGPSQWSQLYYECAGRGYESPIEIKDQEVKEGYFNGLEFVLFDPPITKAEVQNKGWTVMIIPKDGVKRSINWRNDNYTLINIHFHFGSESDPGAEHVINGVTYPMEIVYQIHDGARDVSAMLSTFMNVDDEDNSAFGPIIDVFSDIRYRKDSTRLESGLDLSKLLPEISRDYDYFYFYEGSRSSPPCEPESFRWILKDIGKVGRDQLDIFMTLYSVEKKDASDECRIGPNARPVQNHEGRRIFSGPSP